MKDRVHSGLTPSIPAVDAAATVTSALEIAFGCLWANITDDPGTHQARSHLGSVIGRDGQRRGVQWAVQHLPAMTDADFLRIDL